MPADPLSRDEVVAAAVAAQAHELVSALPDGHDTQLGEGGNRLSGGERQRISIARAIKDAGIVLLDEATASVDASAGARHPALPLTCGDPSTRLT